MGTQPVVYNGILFSLKKEGNSGRYYNMAGPYASEINQSRKDKYCMIPLT